MPCHFPAFGDVLVSSKKVLEEICTVTRPYLSKAMKFGGIKIWIGSSFQSKPTSKLCVVKLMTPQS